MPKVETDRLEGLASAVGEPVELVLDKSVESYIDQEIREAEARITEIREKNGADTTSELEEKIEKGEIEEHPAWEELIEWQNLKKRVKKLKTL